MSLCGSKCRCTVPRCLGCLSISSCAFGLLLFVSILTLYLVFPTLRDHGVVEELVIKDGSPTFRQLMNPTVPIYKDIYFFNLTNPEEFQAGDKPNLFELGPYSYRETRMKNNLSISEDKSMLTYSQTRVFHFSPNTSSPELSEDDTICTINLPLVAAFAQLQDARNNPKLANDQIDQLGPRYLRDVIMYANAKLYVCQPATALAFNYTDQLIQDLHSSNVLMGFNLSYPRTDVSIQLNNSGSNSPPSTIYTGAKDINSIGQYVQWQGLQKLMLWPNGMGANDINGTEGLFFHPLLQEGEDIEIFVDDIYRSVRLFHVDSLNRMGLKAFRYMLVNSTFESAFKNPENVKWGSWNPEGLFYLGPTQTPAVPVFGSKPHFLDGDPKLLEKVNGLNPDRERHESFLDVEPTTGVNIQVQIKIQVNAQVNQSSELTELNNVNGTVYFPILYIDQHTVLRPSFVDFLMDNGLRKLNQLTVAVHIIFYVGISIAVICFICSSLCCISCLYKVHSNSERKHLKFNGTSSKLTGKVDDNEAEVSSDTKI